jgi:hypothetical protein
VLNRRKTVEEKKNKLKERLDPLKNQKPKENPITTKERS